MKQTMKTGMVLVLAAAICLTGAQTNMAKKKEVAISKNKLNLTLGQTSVLKLKDTKANAKWTSGNDECAKVSKKGKVKAVGIGMTTIRAKIGKKTYSCKVTVSSGIKVSEKSTKYNNTVFTKEFVGKIKQISFGERTVKDKMALKQIAAWFSELTLQETTELKGLHAPQNPNNPSEIKAGVLTPVCFTLTDGTEYRVDCTEGQLGVMIVQGSEKIETYYNDLAYTKETANIFMVKIDDCVEKYCEK